MPTGMQCFTWPEMKFFFQIFHFTGKTKKMLLIILVSACGCSVWPAIIHTTLSCPNVKGSSTDTGNEQLRCLIPLVLKNE